MNVPREGHAFPDGTKLCRTNGTALAFKAERGQI